MGKSIFIFFLAFASIGYAKPRARGLGIPFEGEPGPLNAITDVQGIEVGHVTLIQGESKLGIINGVVRTGVTAVWPSGKKTVAGVPGAWATANGNGEMSGIAYIDESGLVEGPIVMTNTQSLGTARDAVVKWFIKHFPIVEETFLPIVGETDDSWLNDLYGFHVKDQHVFDALENAKTGPVAEGNVGGGTSNVSFRFKAGIGTASRKLPNGHTLGVLVQSNFGHREDLTIAGIPMGKEITELPLLENPFPKMYPAPKKTVERSIVVVIATDVPLLPHQLRRVAKRAAFGLARLGSIGRNTSGEFFLAFSTVRPTAGKKGVQLWSGLEIEKLDPIFEGAIQATEEAVLNAMAAAETMDGVNGNKVHAVPWDHVQKILKRHNRFKG